MVNKIEDFWGTSNKQPLNSSDQSLVFSKSN